MRFIVQSLLIVSFFVVLGLIETFVNVGFLENGVVKVDFPLDIRVLFVVRVRWIEFGLELLIVRLDGFVVVFDDSLFSELFVLVKFLSPVLKELVHLLFAD